MASAMASINTIYGKLSDQISANVVSSSWTNEGINYNGSLTIYSGSKESKVLFYTT